MSSTLSRCDAGHAERECEQRQQHDGAFQRQYTITSGLQEVMATTVCPAILFYEQTKNESKNMHMYML